MTPTCEYCGTKFPGNPCIKCGLPPGLSEVEVERYRIAYIQLSEGVSLKRAKQMFHTNRKPRRRHGRQVKTRG